MRTQTNHVLPSDRPVEPKRKRRVVPQVKRVGERVKERELAARLIAAANEADKGPEGENVTGLSSEEFIALLRR